MAVIAKTKFLELKSVKSPSGHDWFYVKRTNDSKNHDSAVVITTLVKIDDEWNFLFLKTKRPPLYAENKADFCLESPAGLIGDENSNENLLECAKKELLEEAGLSADKFFIELTNSSVSSGLASETLSYVTAIVAKPKQVEKPITDGGIIIDRFYIKAAEVLNYLKNIDKNTSVASATVCGIYFALERLRLEEVV